MCKIVAAAVIAACLSGSFALACEYDYAAAVAHAKGSNNLLLVGQGGHTAVIKAIAKLRAERPSATGALLRNDAPYRDDATETAMFKFARDPNQAILLFGKAGCVVQIVRVGPFGVMSLDPAKYALLPF